VQPNSWIRLDLYPDFAVRVDSKETRNNKNYGDFLIKMIHYSVHDCPFNETGAYDRLIYNSEHGRLWLFEELCTSRILDDMKEVMHDNEKDTFNWLGAWAVLEFWMFQPFLRLRFDKDWQDLIIMQYKQQIKEEEEEEEEEEEGKENPIEQ
jgi:hypothetical protein